MKRKLVSFLLLFLMIFQMVTPVLAAGSIEEALGDVNIQDGGHSMNYLIAGNGVQNLNYCYYKHTNKITGEVTEVPAYCVNPNDPGVSQVGDYIVSATQIASDPKIVGIASNSYPHMSLEALNLKDKYEGYYAGKIAIWCYLLSSWDINKIRVNPNCSDQAAAERVLNAAKYAYQQGTTWNSHVKPSFTVVANSSMATVDNLAPEYLSQTFTVKSDTWVVDGSVDVRLKQGQETYGAKIVNADTNAPISQITMKQDGNQFWGKFKVLYPKDQIAGKTGNVQFDLSSTVYKYEVFYGVSYDKAKQDYLVDTDPKYYASTAGTSSFAPGGDTTDTDQRTDTGIKILKYETGTTIPLSGAVFEVIDPDGETVGTFTTNDQGIVIVPCAKMGNHTIKELTPPKYHLMTKDNVVQVDVKYNEVSMVTMYNDPYGNLEIEKLDADSGKRLGGATIQIKHIETGKIQTVKTETGTGVAYLEEMLPGAYEIQEIAPPSDGYIMDTKIHTVNVVAGETSRITITNQAKPGLKILKYDNKSKEPLANVIFEVYRDTELLGEYTTGQMGEVLLENIQPGTYLVKEVASDETHVVNSTPQQVEVKAGQGIVELVFLNELKPGISLVKLDSATMEPIVNVKFRISQIGGSFSKEFTTGEDGHISLDKLEPGAYEVVEVKTVDTHLIDDNCRVIQINAGENAEFVFTNTQKPAMTLVKYDPVTNKPIPGVTFKIGLIGEDGTAYDRYTTDVNGEIHIEGWDCNRGTLSIIECVAADGFILDETEYHLQLFAGKTSQLALENKHKPSLKIVKTDALTGKPISGVTFIVKEADGSTVTTVTTDEQGEALIENLEPQTYQITEQSVPENYLLDKTPQLITLEPNRTGVVQFQNYPRPQLEIVKTDTKGNSIAGAVFEISEKGGEKIGDYTTDGSGKINVSNLKDGKYYVLKEKSVPEPYILDSTPQEVYLEPGKVVSITVENHRKPTLTIRKVNSVTGKPIKGTKFEVWQAVNGSLSGELKSLGTYYTDEKGEIHLQQVVGWVRVKEIEPSPGYTMKEPISQDIFLETETDKVVIFENEPLSAILIHKVDSETGRGIPNVSFLLYDSGHNPIGQYESDQDGYVYINDRELTAGRYYLREIKAGDGYHKDDNLKTVYVKPGETTEIRWENTAIYGQIQVIKKSANDNLINGLPAGSLLEGAVFEIYDKAGNTVDRIVSDKNGRAVSKLLPLSRYTVREVKSAPYYTVNDTIMTAYLEFAGQIVTFEMLNESVSTGVSITKTGYKEVMSNQPIRYKLDGIKNTSTVALNSFYWRDKLPYDVRLEQIATGTYNQNLNYKIVYKTNLSDYRTVADNLSTQRNYVINTSGAALGLAANEHITEVMFVFGTVKAGFANVETPYLYGTTRSGLMNGAIFTNVADVGGLYDSQWIMGVSRWVTKVYNKVSVTLPKTGY